MMNLQEAKHLSNALEKIIDGILEIDEDKKKDSKAIFPIYRALILKRNLDKAIKKEEEIENECNVRETIRRFYQ